MKSNKKIIVLKKLIENFETRKSEGDYRIKETGTVYTPKNVANLMVYRAFNTYMNKIFNFDDMETEINSLDNLPQFISKTDQDKSLLQKKITKIKFLDPSCGSGRFLLQIAKLLLRLKKLLSPHTKLWDLKKQIIKNNIFGIDFDKDACIISKLRLLLWMLKNEANNHIILERFDKPYLNDFNYIDTIFEELDINFNVLKEDFLLNYNPNKKFDIIIGNPPYIDNKKISDKTYKEKLYNSFESAYKLFDLSILFLEKSLNLLKQGNGIISFIMTNKFLSSNYGFKIRKLLLKKIQLLSIIDISTLPIFSNRSIYPIIISILNKKPKDNNKIIIEKYNDIVNFINQNNTSSQNFTQNELFSLPDMVIPLEGDINLINSLFTHFETLEGKFSDLNIIYRPYAFLNYSKYYQYATEKRFSEDDLILLGTGNVGKYYYKFHKKIRISNQTLSVSYFHPPDNEKSHINILATEKLIFREIAKNLTCVYDPGVFTNITGLYFITIPSLSTGGLFSLLTILNSSFIDNLFKCLYNTLHMSGNYLRFNGSFIKTIPVPDELPNSLARIGKILQFIRQYHYDMHDSPDLKKNISQSQIEHYISLFQSLCEALTRMLFLSKLELNFPKKYSELYQYLIYEEKIPNIPFIFPKCYYDFPKVQINSKQLSSIFSQLNDFHDRIKTNNKILDQIYAINSLKI